MQDTSFISPVSEVPALWSDLLAQFEVKPQVSIIIPALNEAKIIENLLQSFTPEIRQRLGLELILSDGGSTDDTISLAKPFVDKVVLHERPERQTIAAGRNAGAAASKGDVLLFFNADVRLPQHLESFLRDLIEAVEQNGAATCNVEVHPDEARWSDRLVLGACNVYFHFLNVIGVGMGRGECHAVSRTIFEALGGYRAELAAGEDFDLYNRIARHTRQHRSGKIRFLSNWAIYEDPRRYRAIGYARTMLKWFENAASIFVRGRALDDEWTPFR